jgi:hypothetical protein
MKRVKVIDVQRDGDDGILVTFSDDTIAGYLLQELMALRPYRESSRTNGASSFRGSSWHPRGQEKSPSKCAQRPLVERAPNKRAFASPPGGSNEAMMHPSTGDTSKN